jgi:hypothetical protein
MHASVLAVSRDAAAGSRIAGRDPYTEGDGYVTRREEDSQTVFRQNQV